jgi:hypothetical protein
MNRLAYLHRSRRAAQEAEMINWRAVVVTVLLNAALINAAAIGFATAKSSPAANSHSKAPIDYAYDHDPVVNPG